MSSSICLIVLITGIIIYGIIQKRKPTIDQKLQEIKTKILPLDSRIANINFYIDHNEAYALNGKDVYMCLRDANGDYYSDNFLIYVALHEVSHILISEDTKNHPPVFTKFFDDLKERAESLKLYNSSIPFPNEYCKKKLNYY